MPLTPKEVAKIKAKGEPQGCGRWQDGINWVLTTFTAKKPAKRKVRK